MSAKVCGVDDCKEAVPRRGIPCPAHAEVLAQFADEQGMPVLAQMMRTVRDPLHFCDACLRRIQCDEMQDQGNAIQAMRLCDGCGRPRFTRRCWHSCWKEAVPRRPATKEPKP